MAASPANPRMGKHLCRSQPSLRVPEEKAGYKVLGRGGDGGPGEAREAKVASRDGGQQLALALRAAGALLPAAVDGGAGGGEGGAARQQDVQQHPQAPQVAGLGVAQGSFAVVEVVFVREEEGVDNLGSHELEAADWAEQAVGGVSTGKLGSRAEVKIAQFDGARRVRADAEHVLRFDVTMGDSKAVQVADGRGKVVHDAR